MRVNMKRLFQVRSTILASVIGGALSVAAGAYAADSMESHLAKCETELQALYGDDMRARMIKAKTYKGNHKMRFKVYPAGQPSTVIECAGAETAEQAVILRSQSGEVLNP